VQGSGICPLQVIQDEDKRTLSGQHVEVASNSIVKIAPFRLGTGRLRLREIRQFVSYFRRDFSQVDRAVPQHSAQLFGRAGPCVRIDSICNWLVGEQAAHFVTIPPQYGCLLLLLFPFCKLAGQARLTYARLTGGKYYAALSIAGLLKGTLHARKFLCAPDQFGLQNTLRVELTRNRQFFRPNAGLIFHPWSMRKGHSSSSTGESRPG
jgi:hypothetical protein